MNEQELRCLSFHQLELFIRADDHTEACKREWKKRTGRNYPRMPRDPVDESEFYELTEEAGQVTMF